MALIKANQAPQAMSPFSLRDVEEHARKLIARATLQADQIRKDAAAEAEKIKADARASGQAEGQKQGVLQGIEQGKAAGHKQALEEHRQALTELQKALLAMVEQWDEHNRQLVAHGLGEVVQLALSVARRVTKRQAELDPRVLEANLEEAMKLVVHSTDLRIAISPRQLSTLQDAIPRLALTLPAVAHAELVADADIAVGGCRLMMAGGAVDADIDAQLDRVIGELLPETSGAE